MINYIKLTFKNKQINVDAKARRKLHIPSNPHGQPVYQFFYNNNWFIAFTKLTFLNLPSYSTTRTDNWLSYKFTPLQKLNKDCTLVGKIIDIPNKIVLIKNIQYKE